MVFASSLGSSKICVRAQVGSRGKRVGVPEYQQTAALWSRGILEHEFGVAPKDMEFWMERTPDISHGGSTGFEPPEGVTVHQWSEFVAAGRASEEAIEVADDPFATLTNFSFLSVPVKFDKNVSLIKDCALTLQLAKLNFSEAGSFVAVGLPLFGRRSGWQRSRRHSRQGLIHCEGRSAN